MRGGPINCLGKNEKIRDVFKGLRFYLPLVCLAARFRLNNLVTVSGWIQLAVADAKRVEYGRFSATATFKYTSKRGLNPTKKSDVSAAWF